MAEHICIYADEKTPSGLRHLPALTQEEWKGVEVLQNHPQHQELQVIFTAGNQLVNWDLQLDSALKDLGVSTAAATAVIPS